MPDDRAVTVIVLAGGASRRMTQPKALLPFDGRTLLEHVAAAFAGFGETIVVSGPHLPLPPLPDAVRVLVDPVPLQGPATALLQAFDAAAHDLCFATSCDQPFPHLALARRLIGGLTDAEVVIPRWQGRLQPLFAAYRRRVAEGFRGALEEGERGLLRILDRIPRREVADPELERFDPRGLSFFDVDTRKAYEEALRLLRESR